jgi:hypothetical protein
MVDDLRAKQYTALILDAPVLEYVTGTNEECDLFTIGDVFETFSLALAFPPAADDAMVFDFSKSIVSLQVRRLYEFTEGLAKPVFACGPQAGASGGCDHTCPAAD